MEKVLRAMDVIPPFDSHGEPHNGSVDDRQRVSSDRLAPAGRCVRDETPLAMVAGDVVVPGSADEAIPTLDLGEKILAEQRRATARTRRAPGDAGPVPNDLEEETLPPPADSDEAVSDDVAQLQQTVADIVARDIKRLCQGLRR